MSEISNGQNGMKAVEAKDYKKGIELLTKAINVTRSPAWLLSRSLAYQRTKQLTAALDDADAAYHAALARTQPISKQHMIDAQYRRGVVLLQMDRPADADACCVWSQQIIQGKKFHREEDDVRKHVDADGEYKATAEEAKNCDEMPKGPALQNAASSVEGRLWTRAYMTRQMALPKLEKLPKGDPRRKITVERVPPKPKALGKGKALAEHEPAPVLAQSTASVPAPATQKTQMLPPPIPAPKPAALRFDFFQTDKTVTITLFIKSVDKGLLKVQVSSTIVTISDLPLSSGAPDPLYLQLDGPVKDSYSLSVTPNKIEVSLEKAVPGIKWKTWGKHHDKQPVETIDLTDSPTPTPSVPITSTTTASQTMPPPPKPAGPPAYPTSSKSGPKNWDNLNMDGSDENGDQGDVNTFFKQLYKGATPEQQRAMMKSFTESNGTALSTDWQDVGSRKVETKPPEGVEAKKW